MLDPIGKPEGKYNGETLNLNSLPLWGGAYEVIEPKLGSFLPNWQVDKSAPPAPEIYATDPDLASQLDRALLDGKLTVVVYCYGPHVAMHTRCLMSIVKSIPADRLVLKIGLHNTGPESVALANSLKADKVQICEYSDGHSRYEIMRDLLHDEDDPITTKYVAWFDYTCYVKNLNWVNILADEIVRQKPSVAAYGLMYYHRLQEVNRVRDWIQKSPWYHGKMLLTRRGTEAPNGDSIQFCADWFWVMRTQAIYACDIPDPRIVDRHGDVVVGAQLHQGGYKIKSFNTGQSMVYRPPEAGLPTRTISALEPWR